METNWPPHLSELLGLTERRAAGRAGLRERVLAFVGPHLDLLAGRRVVKVAGTNGKGSLCAMLEACLGRGGLRTGLFTSPHLRRVTERFRVAGVEASPEAVDRHAGEVLRLARRLIAERGDSYAPSFFECLILTAIRLFNEERVDVAIFEAGVGGYNDAVSLLPGEFSAVTSVGMDHQEQLGDTPEAIAADKAGIASPGAHLVLGPDIPPPLREVIARDARGRGVAVSQATLAGLRAESAGLQGPTIIDVAAGGRPLRCELPLLGRHQISNFATLVKLLEVMARRGAVRDLNCLEGVARTRWAGRLEVRGRSPRYVIDAAHNEQGILALADSLDDLVPRTRRVLLYGASADKDYRACLPHLPRLAPRIFLVEGFHRAERARAIAGALPGRLERPRIFDSPGAAVEFFANSPLHRDKFVVAAGSIFMIGEVMSRLDSAEAAADRGGRGS